MPFKKKAALLLALVIILAVAYILSFVFDPDSRRGTAFAWLDPRFLDYADRIEIYGTGGAAILVRRNNVWYFRSGGQFTSAYTEENPVPLMPLREFPVKQARVEELLTALSRKEFYTQRAVSAEARERLGLAEGRASRIIIRGGAGLPLLDLFVGVPDALGREVHLRRQERNEIYSAEDRFTVFTDSRISSWYELRLFPPERRISVEQVQHVEVTLPDGGSYNLDRSFGLWMLRGNDSAVLDSIRVNNWLRSVLEAEGEDFSHIQSSSEAGITLWLGDGTTHAISIGAEDAGKRRSCAVQGSSLVYVLSEYTVNRVLRECEYFFIERHFQSF